MKKIIIPLFVLTLIAVPFVVSATSAAEDLVCRVLTIARNVIVMVGFFFAIAYLVVGAIKYLTSQGDDEKATTARKMIVNSLIGIAILVGIFIIISFVATTLGDLNLGGAMKISPCPGLNQ